MMVSPWTSETEAGLRPCAAVALLSGGLDSTVAAAVVLRQGIEVHGVHFALPWGSCHHENAKQAASVLGIPLTVMPLDERFIRLVRNPKYGYGRAMNPCTDCHAHMVRMAGMFMEQLGFDFVISGEVLGQRPNSQLSRSMRIVEKESGLEGRLLRPLSAKRLRPTLPELQGKVDRRCLFGICGRSRKQQMKLARQFGIQNYPTPAGGCLLTDKGFAARLKDLFSHQQDPSLEEVALLRYGRQFRISSGLKILLGRDESENTTLASFCKEGRQLVVPENFPGPSALAVGETGDMVLKHAVRLILRFTKPAKIPSGELMFRVDGEYLLPIQGDALDPLPDQLIADWQGSFRG